MKAMIILFMEDIYVKKIKDFMWNHKMTAPIMNMMHWLKRYLVNQIVFYIKAFLRKRKLGFLEYQEIKKYKDIHNGERCFILATGPSLTIEDVSLLKDEVTFGMNSICMLFEKLGWETTYYGVQDLGVYRKLKEFYAKFKFSKLFIGDGIPWKERMDIKHIPYALNYLNHRYSYKKLTSKFSEKADEYIYDGYTITYSLMQLAIYMGFSEIYLLGNDCSYSNDPQKQHFMDFGHYDKSTQTARDRILFAYQYAYEYLKNSDVKIFNATRGGELEIFPRVKLEDVLKENYLNSN